MSGFERVCECVLQMPRPQRMKEVYVMDVTGLTKTPENAPILSELSVWRLPAGKVVK